MNVTIDHRDITVDGVGITVSLVPDEHMSPTDYDCHDAEDISSSRRDEWCYVGVIVALTDHPYINTSLWGVAYGAAPGWYVGMGKIISEYPGPEMINELRTLATESRDRLSATLAAWGSGS